MSSSILFLRSWVLQQYQASTLSQWQQQYVNEGSGKKKGHLPLVGLEPTIFELEVQRLLH